ncbi:hypothetical protein [Natronolimnobius baerhuensis]|uniref:Yip1 domain-containing protein n=1 Tax=Natronolimnobius baerhuensis TaxID=253108 RepID=A0A202EA82_9EURY|nr:hypothetical protein [Natronolimnobius baerhuensis]OVE84880.1 hypothetical protein B2G88_10960 [Natronolimnobius baerhuensis]
MSQRASSSTSDWTILQPWRELLGADTISAMIDVVRQYGWLPALFGVALHSLARGVFEYMSDPFVITEGYFFTWWPAALAVSLFFGTFIVIFSWFVYFGLIGVIAGFFSSKHDLAFDTFKFGGYLTAIFAPIFLLGSVIILTVTAPAEGAQVAVENGDDFSEFATTAYSFVHDTPQMHVVQILKAAGWIITGFLMLPIVQHLYEIDEKRSVASVLPVTLAGVLIAFLV